MQTFARVQPEKTDGERRVQNVFYTNLAAASPDRKARKALELAWSSLVTETLHNKVQRSHGNSTCHIHRRK